MSQRHAIVRATSSALRVTHLRAARASPPVCVAQRVLSRERDDSALCAWRGELEELAYQLRSIYACELG